MNKKTILIASVVIACLAGYLWFSFSARGAADINDYDIDKVTHIDIEDIEGNRTIKIDSKDKINNLIKILRSDYNVSKISKFRETDIFIRNPVKFSVALYIKDTEIVDMYFLTSFNTVAVLDVKSMSGNGRTITYESLDKQQEMVEELKGIITE